MRSGEPLSWHLLLPFFLSFPPGICFFFIPLPLPLPFFLSFPPGICFSRSPTPTPPAPPQNKTPPHRRVRPLHRSITLLCLRYQVLALPKSSDGPTTKGPTARPIPAWGEALGLVHTPRFRTVLPQAGVQPQAERPNCFPRNRPNTASPHRARSKNKSLQPPPKTTVNPHVNPPPHPGTHKPPVPIADFSPANLAYLPPPIR